MEHEIKIISDGKIGRWDLSDYGIKIVDIPSGLVSGVVTSTPTSHGVLEKFNMPWKNFTDGDNANNIVYVKAGTTGNPYDIKQPISEAIASEIGIMLGFDVMPTQLWVIDSSLFRAVNPRLNPPQSKEDEEDEEDEYDLRSYGIFGGARRVAEVKPKELSFSELIGSMGKVLVGVSPSYNRRGYDYHHCYKTFKYAREEELNELICEQSENIKVRFQQMLLFDFLINNPDRHTRNFGFLRSNTGDFDEFCPLVDHGQCLLAGRTIDDFSDDNLVNQAKGHYMSFDNLAESMKYVEKESLKYIDFSVSYEKLWEVVDKYALLINSERRVRLMKEILKMRWEICQREFST